LGEIEKENQYLNKTWEGFKKVPIPDQSWLNNSQTELEGYIAKIRRRRGRFLRKAQEGGKNPNRFYL